MASEPTHASRFVWFMRGYLLGVLITGSCTAVSFFVRTRGWGTLLGDRESNEAIGFPIQVWSTADGYQVYSLSNPGFLPNLVFAATVSIACGAVLAMFSLSLNRLVQRFEGESQQGSQFQFTIRGILMFTVVAAVVSAIARSLTVHPNMLAGIYLFGPLGLVITAMVPRGIKWQQRVGLIIPGALLLIILAIVVGVTLEIDFDKVLLGIFVCWTPQSTFAAAVLTAAIFFRHRRAICVALAG